LAAKTPFLGSQSPKTGSALTFSVKAFLFGFVSQKGFLWSFGPQKHFEPFLVQNQKVSLRLFVYVLGFLDPKHRFFETCWFQKIPKKNSKSSFLGLPLSS
jgi:hypothetical protein